ncbi:MAG: Protein TonB [Acidobacteria bacterium]|nr:Protein TonB [Acidobacteriota bacterium]
MSDRKPCVHCGRTIDAVAQICPFCNWDQREPVQAVQASIEETSGGSTYVPPPDTKWRKPIFSAIALTALIIGAFAAGLFIHRKTPEEIELKAAGMTTTAATTTTVAPTRQAPHSTVTLVPTTESAPSVEQPITSAPATNIAQGVPNEYQRNDATAVSSEEYTQLAQRAKAEKKQMSALVDPRSITGVAYGAPAPRRIPLRPLAAEETPMPPPQTSAGVPGVADEQPPQIARPPARSAVMRTQPVPTYQPLPQIRVSHNVTARLELTVGPDGRVREVNIRQAIPGDTARLIATVQSWRFRPATENGQPVTATVPVDISFNAHE